MTRSSDLLDLLRMDGGWLTAEGLALCFPRSNPEAIGRALYRLRHRGQVEMRIVELAGNGRQMRPGQIETRKEWRAVLPMAHISEVLDDMGLGS